MVIQSLLRRAFRFLAAASAALIMAPMAPARAADVYIGYLAIPGPYPSSPITSSSIASPATYTLPGYGPVKVSWNAKHTYFNPQNAQATTGNRHIVAAPDVFSWGTDTQFIGMIHSQADSYTVKFDFLNGPLDLNRLEVITLGMGFNGDATTATVSEAGRIDAQYQYAATGAPAAPTKLDGTGRRLSNGFTLATGTVDSFNSSWALFGIRSPASSGVTGSHPSLSVDIHRIGNDGIGLTLGYRQAVLTIVNTLQSTLIWYCHATFEFRVDCANPTMHVTGSMPFVDPPNNRPDPLVLVIPNMHAPSYCQVTQVMPVAVTSNPPSCIVHHTPNQVPVFTPVFPNGNSVTILPYPATNTVHVTNTQKP